VSAALAVTTIFWASAFAGIRVGLEAYGPGQVALMRFLVASVVLAAYAAITRMRLPERRDLPAVFLAGFLAFTVYHVALNYGEVTVSAGAASILINTAPLFTALLAVASHRRAAAGVWLGRNGGELRGAGPDLPRRRGRR
jgi:drug/metabolite transporter (DMT)-like permease